MNKGNTAVDKGQVMINDAGKSFNDIVQSIENVSNQMAIVVDVIQGLYKNSDSMIKSVQNVSNVAKIGSQKIKDIASSSDDQIVQMQQVSEAAQALTEIVVTLQGDISKFKL